MVQQGRGHAISATGLSPDRSPKLTEGEPHDNRQEIVDPKDLDEVNRFLLSVSKRDLYTYYGVSAEAASGEVDEAINRKRKWAQGQQSNPKYKNEAIFLIKSHTLLRRVLLEEGAVYRKQIQQQAGSAIDVFTGRVQQAVERGLLSAKQEAGLQALGRDMGLNADAVSQQISRVLSEEGARRETDESFAGATDLYRVIGAGPSSTEAEIEAAYRNRYRWARNLQDTRKSAEILGALDEAYRILKDPNRRAAYDEHHRLLDQAAEMNNNTGVFDVGRRAETSLKLAAEGYVEEAMKRLRAISGDPFADAQRPSDNTYFPEDTEPTDGADPFAPGGSLASAAPVGERRPVHQDADPPTPLPIGSRIVESSLFPAKAQKPEQRPEPEQWRPTGRPEGHRTDPKIHPAAPVSPPAPTANYAPISPTHPRTPVPRLLVDGPTHYNLENPLHPVTIQVKVRNDGVGRMSGKITAKEAWLDLSATQLDADAHEQVLVVTINPEKMPFGFHSGTIRIAGDHGERRDISIEVVRPEPPNNRRMAILGLASIALLLGVIGLWFMTQDPGGDEAGRVPVELRVVPRADRVTVIEGDKRVEVGRDNSVFHFNRPVGEKTRIEVTSLGFAPVQQSIQVIAPSATAEVLLTPDIDMSRPPPSNRPETSASVDVRAQVIANADALSRCFQSTGALSPRFTAWVAGSSGLVLWVGLDPASEVVVDRACLQRIFRGMRFPPFKAEDAVVPVSGVSIGG